LLAAGVDLALADVQGEQLLSLRSRYASCYLAAMARMKAAHRDAEHVLDPKQMAMINPEMRMEQYVEGNKPLSFSRPGEGEVYIPGH
jgi:hypothetical protein